MKKILASVAALAAISGFASAASAQTITQTASVPAVCTVNIADGTFPTNVNFVSVIESDTNAFVETRCSSAASTLTLALDTHVAGTDDPGVLGQTINRQYSLPSGTGAYSPTGSAGGVTPAGLTTTTTSILNLSNAYNAGLSRLNIKLRITPQTAGQFLAAGTYKARVIATVTP
jgi:hypothetical protein